MKTVTWATFVAVAYLCPVVTGCSGFEASQAQSDAIRSFDARDYKQAADTLNKAISLEPENSTYYLNRSAAYREMGQFQQAKEDTDRAVQLAPNTPLVYDAQGVNQDLLGNYQQAIADYDEGLKIVGSSRPNHNNEIAIELLYLGRAAVYCETAQYENAIQDADRGIAVTPASASTPYLILRGFAHGGLDQYNDALRDLNAAAERAPSQPDVYYYLGLTYDRLGQHQRAVNNYQESLRNFEASVASQPKRVEDLCEEGIVLVKTGNDIDANTAFNRCLSSWPESKTFVERLAKDARTKEKWGPLLPSTTIFTRNG